MPIKGEKGGSYILNLINQLITNQTTRRERVMNEQDYKNIKPFLKELLKMQQAIYLACDASVAADVSLKTSKAITLIGRLVLDNSELKKALNDKV